MKKITRFNFLILIALSFVLIYSCDRELEDLVQVDIPEAVSVYDLDIHSFDLTKEQLEKVKLLSSRKDHNIALQATANWGNFSRSKPEASYSIMGKFPQDLIVNLPNGSYSVQDKNNMVYKTSAEFSNFFGRKINFSLENRKANQEFNAYIPKKIQVEKLGQPNRMEISRNGNNILKWEKDPDNQLGVVFLSYNSRNDARDPMAGEIVKSDILVLKDDGEFDLNSIIKSSEQKSILFSLYRGTAVEFNQDVLFSIVSTDMHLYQIIDNL